MNGFFKIQRKFFDHWLWKENRSLSKAEAFLDLLQLAAFAPTKRVIKGSLIELEQGELVASIRYLAARWVWSKDKVATYLKILELDAMIGRKTRHAQTVVTVCNYRRYASPSDTNKDSRQTETGQKPDATKDKGEEGKKVKNTSPPTQAIAWSAADGWSGISDQDRKQWGEAYPACNIPRQLAAAHQWLLSNSTKAKKKQWRRFITGWLGRAQERGGDAQSNRTSSPSRKLTNETGY